MDPKKSFQIGIIESSYLPYGYIIAGGIKVGIKGLIERKPPALILLLPLMKAKWGRTCAKLDEIILRKPHSQM